MSIRTSSTIWNILPCQELPLNNMSKLYFVILDNGNSFDSAKICLLPSSFSMEIGLSSDSLLLHIITEYFLSFGVKIGTCKEVKTLLYFLDTCQPSFGRKKSYFLIQSSLLFLNMYQQLRVSSFWYFLARNFPC